MKLSVILYSIIAMAAVVATSSCNSLKKTGSSGCCQFTKKLPVGIQLYTVRTDLKKDFYGTLKAIKDMGYAGVEFSGDLFGNSPVQVKRWCSELGLIPFSSHVPYQDMVDNFDKVLEENTILGVQYLVFPYMHEQIRPGVDPEQFVRTVELIGECGKKASAAGFQLLYHNHEFEFVNMPDGTCAYDYIFDQNDRSSLQNEIDVCWADYAGSNPVELLKKYSGGIPVVHLKDYKLEGKLSFSPYVLIGMTADHSMKEESGWFEYRPLGEGQMDIPAVIQTAIDGGTQWLCVEQDEPSMGLNRLESAAKSAEYLKSLGLL